MSDSLKQTSTIERSITEEDLAEMIGGKIVTFEGKRFLSFGAAPTAPTTAPTTVPTTAPTHSSLSYGEIVCVTKSGIVGIISTKLKSQYFIGVPKGHLWFNQKASAFNSLEVPISVYGKVTHTDLDSLENEGKIMRSIAIAMTMDSLSDKRDRYWITWDSNLPSGLGSTNLLKKEVKKICQIASKV